jgi:FdhE protein
MSGAQFPEISIGQAADEEFARLPRLPQLFEQRATRMTALAGGHALRGFLELAAQVFKAQSAACGCGTVHPLPQEAIARALEHGMPVLPADSWTPTDSYRQALRHIVSHIGRDGLPAPAVQVLDNLAGATDAHLNDLATAFLGHGIPPQWQGEMMFIAAGLQVEFARLAATLDRDGLKALDAPGLCPVCGSPPVGGVVAADEAYGRRFLTCSLCSTSWHHVRATCAVCGGEKQVAYQEIEGGNGLAKCETCGDCKSYTKVFYQSKDMAVEAMCDDLATLALDLLVNEAGWKRNAPNPFMLVL